MKINKSSLIKAIVVAFSTLIIYNVVVIITTPNLSPFESLKASFFNNWFILLSLSLAMALQILARELIPKNCKVKGLKVIKSSSYLATGFASFFSYFSLVSFGCCGVWLYILSLLPSLLGVGVAGFMIRFGPQLSITLALLILSVSIITIIRSIRLNARLSLQKS